MNPEVYNSIIAPWQVYFDESWKRNYFHNSLTNECVWDLPAPIKKKLEDYLAQKEKEKEKEEIQNSENPINMLKFLSEDTIHKTEVQKHISEDYMSRPARKQVERTVADEFSYRQGDEEYNIWFDRYLSTTPTKSKESAITRCDPELDIGYTKADLYEKHTGYFCKHFAKGCCCEGATCKFFHRIPTIDECRQIDQSRDIFGRARFANHRKDMQGIGAFLQESRTIVVHDFRLPEVPNQVEAMYEILYRHFSLWGKVEDINMNPQKGCTWIRYEHRCMAEFAREAMNSQALDLNEILTIRWASDDTNPFKLEKSNEENEKNLVESVMQQRKVREKRKTAKRLKREADQAEEDALEGVPENQDNSEVQKKVKKIMVSCKRMDDVLKGINAVSNEDLDLTWGNKKSEEMEMGNDLPLNFK